MFTARNARGELGTFLKFTAPPGDLRGFLEGQFLALFSEEIQAPGDDAPALDAEVDATGSSMAVNARGNENTFINKIAYLIG